MKFQENTSKNRLRTAQEPPVICQKTIIQKRNGYQMRKFKITVTAGYENILRTTKPELPDIKKEKTLQNRNRRLS